MEDNNNNTTDGGLSTQRKVLMGAGLAALAAAAAGAIFLYGTEAGRKRRKEIKSWMLKMKADVLDQMETMKDWSEEAYGMIVDSVAKKYEEMKKIDPIEIASLARDLKNHWKTIQRTIQGKNSKPSTSRRPRGRKKKSETSETKSENK